MKTDVNVPSKRKKHKTSKESYKKHFLLASCQPLTKKQDRDPDLDPDP
jgi:hypothetical protein